MNMKHEWNNDFHRTVYAVEKLSALYQVLYQKSLKFCPVIAPRCKTRALKINENNSDSLFLYL